MQCKIEVYDGCNTVGGVLIEKIMFILNKL